MNSTYESCFICQQEYTEKNIVICECNHKFHATCIFHWLSIGRNCPYCSEVLVNSNIQATNMEDLKRQIISEHELRIKRLAEQRREAIRLRKENEIQPIFEEEGKYTLWINFKEYYEYYGKTIEEIRPFIENELATKCTLNDGEVLKIRGHLKSTRWLIREKIKKYFEIRQKLDVNEYFY